MFFFTDSSSMFNIDDSTQQSIGSNYSGHGGGGGGSGVAAGGDDTNMSFPAVDSSTRQSSVQDSNEEGDSEIRLGEERVSVCVCVCVCV